MVWKQNETNINKPNVSTVTMFYKVDKDKKFDKSVFRPLKSSKMCWFEFVIVSVLI